MKAQNSNISEFDSIDKDFSNGIFRLLEIVKRNQISKHMIEEITYQDIKACIIEYLKKESYTNQNIYELCLAMAQNARELTSILYDTSYFLLEDRLKEKEKEIERKIASSKKAFYTVKEVISMSDIFNIKTENTLIRKLQKGEIRGNMINKRWQIPRESLIDYVKHDKF